MEQLFSGLYSFFSNKKILLIAITGVIAGLSAYYIHQMNFNEDINRLFPENEELHDINNILNTHPTLNRIIINIRSADQEKVDPETLITSADSFMNELHHSGDSALWEKIQYQYNLSSFSDIHAEISHHLPLFLTAEDYAHIEHSLQEENITKKLKRNYKQMVSPMGMGTKKMISRDPLGWAEPVLHRLNNFRLDDNFHLYNERIFTQDNNNLLLFIIPDHHNKMEDKEKLSKLIKDASQHAEASTDGRVKVMSYGSTLIEVANAQQIKKDIIITVSLALTALFGFLFIYFRSLKAILFIFLPFALGAGLTFALFSIFKSEISLIALTIGSVLSGISIDYAIHIFSYGKHHSPYTTLRDISRPILISALTTSSAFLALLTIRAEAFQDLAFFVGVSILLTAFFSLLLLPHAVKMEEETTRSYKNFIHKIAASPLHKKLYLLIFILLVTIFSLFYFTDAAFEEDLQKNNFLTSELKAAEKHLDTLHDFTKKTVFVLPKGNNLQEKLTANEIIYDKLQSLKENNKISNLTSPSTLISSASLQQKKIDQWNTFWKKHNRDSVYNSIVAESKQFNFNASAFHSLKDILYRDHRPQQPDAFPAITDHLLSDYLDSNQVLNIVKVTAENKQGLYTALEKESALVFDKKITIEKVVKVLTDDFNRLVLISMIIVFIVIFIYFQSFQVSLFTFLPMLIGWLWTLSMMGILGITFNVFNIIISSFLFGLGIDYSIFISRGLLDNYNKGLDSLTHYKSSILISVFTTLVGIGVLIFAEHPALKSIAIVSILGIICITFVAFTLQPYLFHLFLLKNKKNTLPPYRLTDFLVTAFLSLVYLTFTLTIWAVSFIFRIFNVKHNKLNVIMYLLGRLMLIPYYGRKEIIDHSGHDFSKPVILAANHQSMLDIPLALSIHKKIIVFVKDWVYNGAFFGRTVKTLGYIPADNIPNSEGSLHNRKKDHSILIFPEGTRSDDGTIARFRSGLVYLQASLEMDIVPVIIHGGYFHFNRYDHFVRRFPVRMTLFPPVNLQDPQWGDTPRQKSKNLRQYYTEEYNKIRRRYENVAFFRRHILANYTFNGWKTYLQARKIVMDKGLERVMDQIPNDKKVLEMHAGNGVFSFFVALIKHPTRQVALCPDDDTRDFFQNRPVFQHSGITNNIDQDEQYDVIIIHDFYQKTDQSTLEKDIDKFSCHIVPGGKIILYSAINGLAKDHFNHLEINEIQTPGNRSLYVITEK